jgi:hypothetical protein
VVTEEGFERTAKRTVSNPNRYTPITLHYFKVLQRLQMQQERYGVRLCWQPSVKHPALTFGKKIREGRERIIKDHEATIPKMPTAPSAPAGDGPADPAPEKKTFVSPIKPATEWGLSGDMRYDYPIDITFDGEYEWDGDTVSVEQSINIITTRDLSDISYYLVGRPFQLADAGNVLRTTVHIGIGSGLFESGVSIQVGATFVKKRPLAEKSAETTAYNAAISAYLIAVQQWEATAASITAAAHKAADIFEQQAVARLSPVTEMISLIITEHFPTAVRDECWEVDYWQRIFDWERASFVAYPSWWSGVEQSDPSKDPSDFINASWAKLYLLIRPGLERAAMRWIFGKSSSRALSPQIEAKVTAIEEDLKQFRTDVTGSSDEAAALGDAWGEEWKAKALVLATWPEFMPTDGTHIEVVQGSTTAADSVSKKESDDAAQLRAAVMANEGAVKDMQDAAAAQLEQGGAVINLNIVTGPSGGRHD